MSSLDNLRMTVRVGADGAVERGIEVPHRAANVKDGGSRVFASTPHHAKAEHFRHNAGVPDDVDLPNGRRTNIRGVTLPHDCRNHIIGFEDGEARDARKAYA